MCMFCRRNLLTGEQFRLWQPLGALGERPVCVLCEQDAEASGWVRLDGPPERESATAFAWHARKVA